MKNSIMVSAGVIALASGLASAQPVAARLVIAQGQPLPGTQGLICGTLNDPYTDGNGNVGFTGSSDGGNFVWYDAGVVWLNSDAVGHTLTGAEGTMGVSNAGGFIYSPTVDGNDGVWTQQGLLLNEGDFIPSISMYSTFNSRPRMTPDGTAYWVGGVTATQGGGTQNRVFFRVSDVSTPVFDALIVGGQVYAGLTITTTASNFAYDVSDNNQHRVHVLTATGSTATDSFVYSSGTDSVLAREGDIVPGTSDAYVSFRIPSINNDGHWVVAADTNAATSMDEVVVADGAVIAREGSVIDGYTLVGTVDAASINNLGDVALIWSGSSTAASVLVVGNISDFAGTARVLLATSSSLALGDDIDTNNDGLCDYFVSDFNASNSIAPGLDLADDGWVYAQVDVQPCGGGAASEAIIGLNFAGGCAADFNGDNQADFFDYLDFAAAFDAEDPSADFNGDHQVDFFDYLDFVQAFDEGCD